MHAITCALHSCHITVPRFAARVRIGEDHRIIGGAFAAAADKEGMMNAAPPETRRRMSSSERNVFSFFGDMKSKIEAVKLRSYFEQAHCFPSFGSYFKLYVLALFWDISSVISL